MGGPGALERGARWGHDYTIYATIPYVQLHYIDPCVLNAMYERNTQSLQAEGQPCQSTRADLHSLQCVMSVSP